MDAANLYRLASAWVMAGIATTLAIILDHHTTPGAATAPTALAIGYLIRR